MAARVLIDAADLKAMLDRNENVVLLDVRWALGQTGGEADHAEGHIPGAVFVPLDTELSAPPTAGDGRHPLPSPDAFQAAARRWGIDDDSTVVAYDDVGNLSAARAWWLLRWAGHEDVVLLDGGLAAWRAAGHPLEQGAVTPAPGTVRLSSGHLSALDADGAAEVARDGALLDARAAERYRGEVEPIDPVAGHVPGAVSAPTTENVGPNGRFLPPDELAARFRQLGVDATRPVAAYCGSGVHAAHEVAALAIAGVDAALYAGSWSQWCNDPSRPVATGPDP
jgi:thiosulfate/3-mercaptopyruvate sulfurtransferase